MTSQSILLRNRFQHCTQNNADIILQNNNETRFKNYNSIRFLEYGSITLRTLAIGFSVFISVLFVKDHTDTITSFYRDLMNLW